MLVELNLSNHALCSTDTWADTVIECKKGQIMRGKDRWVWFQPLWFHRNGDVWATPDWWLEVAKKNFPEHPYDAGLLEVLLTYKADKYRDMVQEKVVNFFQHTAPDSINWYPILLHFYPDLKIAKDIFDNPADEGEYEEKVRYLIGVRGSKSNRDWLEKEFQFWYEDLHKSLDISVIYGIGRILLSLEKQDSESFFPRLAMAKIRSRCLELCRGRLEEYWDLVRIAKVMEWYELLDALENNQYYFQWLFEEKAFDLYLNQKTSISLTSLPVKKKEVIEYDDFENEILAWSLSPHKETTLKMVYLGVQSILKEPLTLTHFAMAIAWKRARTSFVFKDVCHEIAAKRNELSS